jgi:hypothetical protein
MIRHAGRTPYALHLVAVILCVLGTPMWAGISHADEPGSKEADTAVAAPPWRARPFVLETNALFVTPQIYVNVASRWRVGAFAGMGWTYAIRLNDQYENPTEVLNAGIAVSFRMLRGFGVELSPVRLSVITGTDWAQGYPSGHLKLYIADSRVRVATQITAVRVAEGNGAGSYNLYWVPALVAVNF